MAEVLLFVAVAYGLFCVVACGLTLWALRRATQAGLARPMPPPPARRRPAAPPEQVAA